MSIKPLDEVIRVPGGRKDILQSRESDCRCGSAAFEIGESIISPFINFESLIEQRDDLFGIVSFATKFGVIPSSGLPQTLKDCPVPGVRQQATEQIFSAKLAPKVSTPPAKSGLFPAFSRPGDGKLRSEQMVENRLGDLCPH